MAAFFFYGEVGGMGKSLFAETLTHVFGERMAEAQEQQLERRLRLD